MLIKMISTAIGANDGIIAKKYFKENTYDLSETLAKCFLEMGVAVEDKPTAKPTGKGKKVEERDVFNKSLQDLANKDAALQLSNKADNENKGDKK